MTIHHVSREHVVARPRSEVFAFCSRPENLGRITPASMRFELVSSDTMMRAARRHVYRVRPLFRVPTTWVSRVTRFDAPTAFVATAPLPARMPRRPTPLAEGLETYLGHAASGKR